MALYVKRMTEVEAVQWFPPGDARHRRVRNVLLEDTLDGGMIWTFQGTILSPGCWIVEEPNGKRIVVSEEVFPLTYMPAHEVGSEEDFIRSFKAKQLIAYQNAVKRGDWDPNNPKSDAEALSMIQFELVKAFQSTLQPNQNTKVTFLKDVELDLGEALLRLMVLASAKGLKIAEGAIAKMQLNAGRQPKKI